MIQAPRIRCWVLAPVAPPVEPVEYEWVSLGVTAEGDRAAYVLGLDARERYKPGYPRYCLLESLPCDERGAARQCGVAYVPEQKWYRSGAYDFLAARRDRLFDSGEGLVNEVTWAGLDPLWDAITATARERGLSGLFFCVEPAVKSVEAASIQFAIFEEVGATLRDEAGKLILAREGLRAGMLVTAYTDDLVAVRGDPEQGFYLGGDTVRMFLEFEPGRGWYVGIVGNMAAISKLKLYK